MITINPIARLFNVGPAKGLSDTKYVKGVAGDIRYTLWRSDGVHPYQGNQVKVSEVIGILANENLIGPSVRRIAITFAADRTFIKVRLLGEGEPPAGAFWLRGTHHEWSRSLYNPDGISDDTLEMLFDLMLDQMGLNECTSDSPVSNVIPLGKRSIIKLDPDRPNPACDGRYTEVIHELNHSLLKVLCGSTQNRDFAKLARHGYENITLLIDTLAQKKIGLRYTKDNIETTVTSDQLIQKLSVSRFGPFKSSRPKMVVEVKLWDVSNVVDGREFMSPKEVV